MSDKREQLPDEEREIFEFADEDGNVERFEFLDCIEYKGTDYAVLLPEDTDKDDNVYIFEIVEEIDSDSDTYIGIADQKLVDEVYAVFMEKHKNDFDFT